MLYFYLGFVGQDAMSAISLLFSVGQDAQSHPRFVLSDCPRFFLFGFCDVFFDGVVFMVSDRF